MDQFEGDNHKNRAANKSADPFVDAEIPSNEEEITSENRKPSSDNKEQKWPHRIQAGCAILLVIITFLYTYYAREQAAHMEAAVRMAKGQVTEMKNAVKVAKEASDANTQSMKNTLAQMKAQSKAMRDVNTAANKQITVMSSQVAIMQKQFETTYRPWIKVDLEPSGPIVFTGTQFETTFDVVMKNVGRSVATQVKVRYDVLINPNHFTLTEQHKRFCAAPNEGYPMTNVSDSIFPGDILRNGYAHHNMAVPQSVLRDHHEVWPVIMGCVDYRFANSPSHYQSRFMYMIHRPGLEQGVLGIDIGNNLPVGTFMFEKYSSEESNYY